MENESEPKRLSALEQLILRMMIANSGEMFGLEMVESSGNRLKRGTIYVTLSRMEEKRYIKSRKENPRDGARGLPRRLYKPTGQGIKALQEWDLFSHSVGAISI